MDDDYHVVAFALLAQSLVRGGHPFPFLRSAAHNRCGRTNPLRAAWPSDNTRAFLKASRDVGIEDESSPMSSCQMSRRRGVQVTDRSRPVGYCRMVPRMGEGIPTRQPWECGRPRGLQHWGWVGCTPAHLFAQQHAVGCSHGREKCPELGTVGGRQALRRLLLGPNQLWPAPRRGKSWGPPGS